MVTAVEVPQGAVGGSTGIAWPNSDLSVAGVVDAILEIGHQRRSLLSSLRSALESGDSAQALILARQLCGLQGEA
jgi:conjugal transfer/entry exclusion protein